MRSIRECVRLDIELLNFEEGSLFLSFHVHRGTRGKYMVFR